MRKITISIFVLVIFVLSANFAHAGVVIPGMPAVSSDVVSSDIDDDDDDAFFIPDETLRTRDDFISAMDTLSDDKRQVLAEIIGAKQNSGSAIYAQLGIAYSNAATALWARAVGRTITYRDIVKAVAREMKISSNGKTTAQIEDEILATERQVVEGGKDGVDLTEASGKIIETLIAGGVGWELLAARFAWKYLDTDYKKLTTFVLSFAIMRRQK